MFRSRAQTLREPRLFPNVAGPDKIKCDGGHWMSSMRPPVSDAALPLPDLNDREHSKDHLRGETDRSGERSVAGKLIHVDRPNTAPSPTSADISTRNATKPINNRAGTVRATWRRS